ncbi:MAG: GNAT family N-acetyltransferase [Promethearchaeota archaeon]
MNYRLATIEDVSEIVKVNIDTWRTTYSDIFPPEFLQNLSYKEKEIRWLELFNNPERRIFIYLAETALKKIVGFSMGSLEQSDLTHKIPGIQNYIGELMAIYILKEYQRKHIGLKLMKMIVERFLENDIKSMIVWVLKASPNCKFYEILGGKYVGEKMLKYGGTNYITIAYGWDDISQILSY